MKRLALGGVLALASCALPTLPGLPGLPPITEPPIGLLCSGVSKWQVRLLLVEIEKTPNDAGSFEEWEQNMILIGDGPFSSSFQPQTFDLRPHDEIPSKHPIFKLESPSGAGALEMSNNRSVDAVVFGGKEHDLWPNRDDKLPFVRIEIANPCKVSGRDPLSPLKNIELRKCGEDHGRRACYTIVLLPMT